MNGIPQFRNFNNPAEMNALNKLLAWMFGQLTGGLPGKAIMENSIDALRLSYSAKESITTGGRNRIIAGNASKTSGEYLIGEFETADFQPSTIYTFVVKGEVNDGQQISVRFNDGANAGAAGTFVDGIVILRCTSPDSLISQKVRFYNAPQDTATEGSVEWACMYQGDVTSPSMDFIPAIEDWNSSISLLAGAIEAKVSAGELQQVLRWGVETGIVLGRVPSNPSDPVVDLQLLPEVLNFRRNGVPIAWFGLEGFNINEGRIGSFLGLGVYDIRKTADGGLLIR